MQERGALPAPPAAWPSRSTPRRAHRATIAALKLAPKRPPAATSRRLAANDGRRARLPDRRSGSPPGSTRTPRSPSRCSGSASASSRSARSRRSPQAGNPRPRLFRLVEDRAVINRMGFNNRGQPARVRRGCSECAHGTASIGVNIGANKDSADRIADYVAGVRAMAPVADYLTINISSPNTPGLRELQDEGALEGAARGGRRSAAGRPADLPQGRARSRRRRPGPDRPRRDRSSGSTR